MKEEVINWQAGFTLLWITFSNFVSNFFTSGRNLVKQAQHVYMIYTTLTDSFTMAQQPLVSKGNPHCPDFTITLRHTAPGRTPLNE
jgi:hypothetical protein